MSNDYLSGAKYCEVYDEPQHRFHLRNVFANIYEIELPENGETWFHRHTEDTVYFVIADAKVRESFQDKPSVLTTAEAGGTLCRAHREEHLIHQVTNLGQGTMHMLGAEALARPPVCADGVLERSSHELRWESDRFRVYDIATDSEPMTIDYPVYGLLAALGEAVLGIGDPATATAGLRAGGFVWLEAGAHIELPANFRGFFAEWK